MPIHQFLQLVNLGKNICYAYRARSVEAIHLCKKLEHGLVAISGTTTDCGRDRQKPQPGGIQNVNLLQPESTHERILEAIWDAVQMACSTTGTNSDIDTAFDGISDLLRAQSKGTFALSIQRLQRARQKDENTIRLFGHFSAKYGYIKSIKSSEKKEKHLFTINCGGRRQTHELLVDYPPQVHALAWRLNKRCRSTTEKLSLRNPNFYPHPFIEGLNDDLIGRPLGFLGGQTYGLKPLTGKWTPRVEVYGDGPMEGYFKLESGGFSSVFKGAIELENSKHVVFRDVFGQLVTKNAIENAIKKTGNTEKMRCSAWDSGGERTDTLCTMAEIPFLNTGVTSAWVAAIPPPQPWEPLEAPPAYVLLPTNSKIQHPLSGPAEQPCGSTQDNGRLVVALHPNDSGFFSDGSIGISGPSEARVCDAGSPAAPSNRGLKRTRSRINERGIGAALSIASSNAAFLSPDSSEAFPETSFKKIERKKSWVRRHLVDPVKNIVQEVIQ